MSATIRTTADTTTSTTPAVDVFTHSSTNFPGAWSEEEINMLLDAWNNLLEEVKSPKRRSDTIYKVMRRLRRKGFRQVDKEEVWRQMNTLNTEYKTYLGLEKAGVATVKAKCFGKLDKILGPSETRGPQSVTSEESDYCLNVLMVDSAPEDRQAQDNDVQSGMADNLKEDEGAPRRRQVRRRFNIRRLFQQQQTLLTEMQNVSKAREETYSQVRENLSQMVELQKAIVANQLKMIECLKAWKEAK